MHEIGKTIDRLVQNHVNMHTENSRRGTYRINFVQSGKPLLVK